MQTPESLTISYACNASRYPSPSLLATCMQTPESLTISYMQADPESLTISYMHADTRVPHY